MSETRAGNISEEPIGSKVRRRNGPQLRTRPEPPDLDTESLRTFREFTSGLSNRLPLPSIESMRAGTLNNPVSLMRRFFVAMRSAGLPKERAQRVVVWAQRQVDCLWPMEQTPLAVLEEKAMAAEYRDDLCEKRMALERNAVTLRERIQSQTNEIVCDQLTLARLERELEALT